MTQPVVQLNSSPEKASPVFADRAAYEQFRREYRERVVPRLEEFRRAHQQSQEHARRHRVH